MRAGLLALALAGLTAACTAQAPGGPAPADLPSPSPPPLVGAWRSSVNVSSGAFTAAKGLEFMYVFHADRTLIESSNYDAAPPVPPAYGVWRWSSGGFYEAKYEFFTTAEPPAEQPRRGAGWLPSGRGVFTERINVAPDGKTFTSTIRYELLDVEGRSIAGGGEAQGRGTRIDF